MSEEGQTTADRCVGNANADVCRAACVLGMGASLARDSLAPTVQFDHRVILKGVTGCEHAQRCLFFAAFRQLRAETMREMFPAVVPAIRVRSRPSAMATARRTLCVNAHKRILARRPTRPSEGGGALWEELRRRYARGFALDLLRVVVRRCCRLLGAEGLVRCRMRR